jgi:hypothetical protein
MNARDDKTIIKPIELRFEKDKTAKADRTAAEIGSSLNINNQKCVSQLWRENQWSSSVFPELLRELRKFLHVLKANHSAKSGDKDNLSANGCHRTVRRTMACEEFYLAFELQTSVCWPDRQNLDQETNECDRWHGRELLCKYLSLGSRCIQEDIL